MDKRNKEDIFLICMFWNWSSSPIIPSVSNHSLPLSSLIVVPLQHYVKQINHLTTDYFVWTTLFFSVNQLYRNSSHVDYYSVSSFKMCIINKQ